MRDASLAFKSGVDEAVDTAYRVFEDYMRLGEESARRWSSVRSGGHMNSDQPTNPAAMAMQYWMEAAQMWMGPWASMMSGGAWTMPRNDPWDLGRGPGGEPSAASDVDTRDGQLSAAFEISTSQPVKATIELTRVTLDRSFLVQDLRPIEAAAGPPLTAIEVSVRQDVLHVALTIPRDQPAGTYSGVILDRTRRRPAGTITVVVG